MRVKKIIIVTVLVTLVLISGCTAQVHVDSDVSTDQIDEYTIQVTLSEYADETVESLNWTVEEKMIGLVEGWKVRDYNYHETEYPNQSYVDHEIVIEGINTSSTSDLTLEVTNDGNLKFTDKTFEDPVQLDGSLGNVTYEGVYVLDMPGEVIESNADIRDTDTDKVGTVKWSIESRDRIEDRVIWAESEIPGGIAGTGFTLPILAGFMIVSGSGGGYWLYKRRKRQDNNSNIEYIE